MEQYSSLCESAAVTSLDAVDTGDEVLGRVQVECGREEVKDPDQTKRIALLFRFVEIKHTDIGFATAGSPSVFFLELSSTCGCLFN